MNRERIGSTRILRPSGEKGKVECTFTDGWSAFDRGTNPLQPIPGFARARTACAIRSARIAKKHGIPTDFVRQTSGTSFIVNEVRVQGHELLSGESHGEHLGIEILYRVTVEGSLWERIQSGEVLPESLGFPRGHVVKKGERLPRLKIEATTKWEKVDQHLTLAEARDIAGLTQEEWDELESITTKQYQVIGNVFAPLGYDILDGKIEMARRTDGTLMIIDVFGGPDECRIIHRNTKQLYCKDVIRNVFKERHTNWMTELNAAKKLHPNDKSVWPAYPPLSQGEIDLASHLYARLASDYAAQYFTE